MAGPAIAAAVMLAGAAVGAAATTLAPDPVTALAGRYSERFDNALVTGETFKSENIAEIVPVDATHAYLRFELAFYNGHSCSLAGVAERQGNALVYQAQPDDTFAGGAPCRLVVRRDGDALAWSDGGGTCKGHCGARGSFLGDSMRWASRRPIRYLARLKASTEYCDALKEWHGR